MDLDVFVTAGLGDNSYLLVSGEQALVVDPQRDIAGYVRLAEQKGARIVRSLETHVHNDYVSGARELEAATGAEIVGPARAGYAFPYRAVSEGDTVELGDLHLMVLETPGHTPEHVSYVVYEGGADTPSGVFTGGSLMVGGAGRTDLLGEELTDGLTRDQYRTLRRLAALPETAAVLPTHGAGSFCGTKGGGQTQRVSTIVEELATNGALAAPDEDAFVREQLSGLLAYPAYYRNMAPINRRGPAVVGRAPRPPALSPEELSRLMETGIWVVDARWRVQFARGHIPGSVNVELGDTFASYVGWVVPFGEPLALVLPEPADAALDEAVIQLYRVGYERLEGHLAGGIDAWRATGQPVRAYRVAGLDELCRRYRSAAPPRILDVRQQVEWDEGHIPGSGHVFVGDLPGHLGEVESPPEGEVWTICATGHRASMAASLLDREGVPVRLVDGTGVSGFLKHCGP